MPPSRIASPVRPAMLLALIVVAAALLRLAWFTGLQWSDDPGYVFDAWDIAHGDYPLPGHVNGLRFLTLLPLTGFLRAFGAHPIAIAAYPFLASLATIALAWAIAHDLAGRDSPAPILSAACAAAVVALHPLDVTLATWMLPDAPISLLAATAAWLTLRSVDRHRYRYAVAAGIAAGACWLVKESGCLCFAVPPAVAAALWFSRDVAPPVRLRRAVTVAVIAVAASFTVVAAEAMAYRLTTGQWDYRFAVLRGFYNVPDAATKYGLIRDLSFYPRAMFAWALDYRAPDLRYYGLAFWAAAIAVVIAVVRCRRAFVVPAVWGLAVFLLAQFGSSRLTEYVPFHRLPRHLEMLTVPVALLLGAGLAGLLLRRRTVGIVVAVLLAADFLVASAGRHRALRREMADAWALAETAARLPAKPVFTDFMTALQLNILTGMNPPNRFLPAEGAAPETVSDAYTVTHAHRGWIEGASALDDLPDWFREPPASWILVDTIRAADHGVHARFDPRIWYAPPAGITAPDSPAEKSQ